MSSLPYPPIGGSKPSSASSRKTSPNRSPRHSARPGRGSTSSGGPRPPLTPRLGSGRTVSTVMPESPGESTLQLARPSSLALGSSLTPRARAASKQQMEDSAVTNDDRRAFVASVSEDLRRLVRHPAPAVASGGSRRKGVPPMKVHLSVLANSLSAEDMANMRHRVDHTLVHLDFFTKASADPTALRQPTFHHVACPESHNIAASVVKQTDTTGARRCTTARSRTLPTRKKSGAAQSKSELDSSSTANANVASSDDEFDEQPRAPRHVRPDDTCPGRLQLWPQPSEEELMEEAEQATAAAVERLHQSGKSCTLCHEVALSARKADERLAAQGKSDKKKARQSKLAKSQPGLVQVPDSSATRVLPAVMRFRALETQIGRLTELTRSTLHDAVQDRSAWSLDKAATAIPALQSLDRCLTAEEACRAYLEPLYPIVISGTRPDDEEEFSAATGEEREARRRRNEKREQQRLYASVGVMANMPVMRWMPLVEGCRYDESQPMFALPRRSLYTSLGTSGSAWEEVYAALDTQHGKQQVPQLAFVAAVSALTRQRGDRGALTEAALWCILTLLRLDPAVEDAARSYANVEVSFAEAFALRDLLASVGGSAQASVIALSYEIQQAVNAGTTLSAAELMGMLRNGFL